MTLHAKTLLFVAACTLVLAVGGARAAEAKQHRYVGEHPVSADVFCHIQAPHVHVYAPAKAELQYRTHDGWSYFVGDPVAYGYAGPKHAYRGAHPIHVDVILGETDVDGDEIEYCYLRGPHYHMTAPPPETRFELRGEAYWYVGDFPPEFEVERVKLARINTVYASIEYERPLVIVEPPSGWVDVLVEVETPGVVVEAPVVHGEAHGAVGIGVQVQVPVPVFEFRAGFAPLVVHDHHDHDERVIVRSKSKKYKQRGHGGGGGSFKVKGRAKGHF